MKNDDDEKDDDGEGRQDHAFTDYVRSLQSGEEPNPATFQAAWDKLWRILRLELRRRGLSEAPPRLLGIDGHPSWTPVAGGPLWELCGDAFLSVLVERLPGLKALAEKLEHIEGIVVGYIRYFLHDRQRQTDPLGYRIFKILWAAVQLLVGKGALYLLQGNPKIRNDTILGVAPGTDPEEAKERDFTEDVTAWDSELLTELVMAPPRELEVLIQKLADLVDQLGVPAFRFGDLIRALQQEVGGRWQAMQRSGEGETGFEEGDGDRQEVVRLVRPEGTVEGQLDFLKLWECVSKGLLQPGKTKPTQRHLRQLWVFIRYWVAVIGEDQLPPHRELERLLKVPRKEIPRLLEILRKLLEICREGSAYSS
jgi:hypothetical protein